MLIFLHFRDRVTLIPIIKDWILPGTTIISDCWKPYDSLGDEGYQHLKVNHSITFKDPETGACTNSIESSWRHAKVVMPQYRRKKDFFPSHLAKYMFMKRCRALNLDPTVEFFRMAGQLYDPTRNKEEEVFQDDGIENEEAEDNEFN
jgi:hypothetical protein